MFILTTECTSLSVTLVVTLRKFLSLLISIAYFDNPFTPSHWLGTTLIFTGTLLFADVFSAITDRLISHKPADKVNWPRYKCNKLSSTASRWLGIALVFTGTLLFGLVYVVHGSLSFGEGSVGVCFSTEGKSLCACPCLCVRLSFFARLLEKLWLDFVSNC